MNVILKCPHCGQDILEKDLAEHNAVAINEFLRMQETKHKAELKIELQQEFDNKVEASRLEQEQEKIASIEKVKKENIDQIEALKNTIVELSTKIEVEQTSKQKDIELEVLKQVQSVEEKYKARIIELENANNEGRLINNKIKGENFEQEVWAELNRYFPTDKVSKITDKGDKADFSQMLKENNEEVGTIVYEVKSGAWSNGWEAKLQGDMAKLKGRYGIIVAASFESEHPGMLFKVSDVYPNIILAGQDTFIFAAQLVKEFMKKEFLLRKSFDGVETFKTKIDEFNAWKSGAFIKAEKDIYDKIDKIAAAEKSILNQVEQIGKARSAILESFKKNIATFIEQYII